MSFIDGFNQVAAGAMSTAGEISEGFANLGSSIGIGKSTGELCDNMNNALKEFFLNGSTVDTHKETGGVGKELDNAGNTSTIKWQDNTYQSELMKSRKNVSHAKAKLENANKLDNSPLNREGDNGKKNVHIKNNLEKAKHDFDDAKSNYNKIWEEGWKLVNNNVDDQKGG